MTERICRWCDRWRSFRPVGKRWRRNYLWFQMWECAECGAWQEALTPPAQPALAVT